MWPNYVKTARVVQVLQDDLQDSLLSGSKISSKVLQDFFTWVKMLGTYSVGQTARLMIPQVYYPTYKEKV